MKKLLVFLVVLAVLAGAAYTGINLVVNRAAATFLPQAEALLASRDVHIDHLVYESIRYMPPRRIEVHNVETHFTIRPEMARDKQFPSFFRAGTVAFKVTDFKNPAGMIIIKNFDLDIQHRDEEHQNPFGRLSNAFWRQDENLSIRDPRQSIARMLHHASQLFQDTRVKSEIDFRAEVEFQLDGERATMQLYTIQNAGYSALRMREADVKKAADIFELNLAPQEIELLSIFPTRAPKIMEITRFAKMNAKDAHKRDRSIPEDAYRHVMWSYLLTREFDAQFAKRITDAHETIPGNTPDERKMDYHNNEMGRQFAERGIARQQIMFKVMYDPQVIRYPDEVSRFYP